MSEDLDVGSLDYFELEYILHPAVPGDNDDDLQWRLLFHSVGCTVGCIASFISACGAAPSAIRLVANIHTIE